MEYRLARTSGTSGDTIRVIERVAPRVPVSDAEWKETTSELDEFKKRQPGAACRGSLERPRFKPAVRELTADELGRVWVETFTPRGLRWEVWQGDKLIASLKAPEREEFVPFAISSDRFAVTKSTDDGGTVVLVYRIVK